MHLNDRLESTTVPANTSKWIRLFIPVAGDQLASSLLGFLFHVIAARVYIASTYGWMVMGWSIVGFGLLAWRAALGVPFVVEYSASRLAAQGSILVIFRRAVVASQVAVLALAITVLAISEYSTRIDAGFGKILAASGFLLATMLQREHWRHVLLANSQSLRLGILGAFSNIFAAAGFIVAAVVIGWSASLAMITMGICVTIGTVFLQPKVPNGARDESFSIVIRRWWLFGKHVMAGVFATLGGTQLVLWLLFMYHEPASVAVLGASMALMGLPRPAIGAATAIITPEIARQRVSAPIGSSTSSKPAVTIVVSVGVVFVIFACVLGPRLMQAVFPTVPAPSVLILGLLAAMVSVEGGGAILKGVFRGDGTPEIESRAALHAAGVGLLLAVLLVPWGGLIGAVVVLLIVQLTFVLSGYVAWRENRRPVHGNV